jgi:chromosome segregation ATPase
MYRPINSSFVRRLAMVSVLSLGFFGVAAADDKDKKVVRAQQERISKMQQIQQALQQEKAQLIAERDEFQGRLKNAQARASKLGQALKQEALLKAQEAQLRAQEAQLRTEAAQLLSQVQALTGEKADLAALLKSTETRLLTISNQQQGTLGQLAATQATLVNTRTAWETAQQSLAQRDKSLAFCQDQNLAFYDINRQLLRRFETAAAKMTPWYALPTQFDRVALENEGLLIRDQIEERKLPMGTKAE